METSCNHTFKELLTEYNLPEDLSFSVEVPAEIQTIIDDEILTSELGVTLKSFDRLYKAANHWENKSIIEDNENHFHVDWHIESTNTKNAFMLGIKTLTLLADKFQKEKIFGIRFWYSFQTPELGNLWAKQNKLDENNEQIISDRLSFYTRRQGEEVVSDDIFEDKFSAIITIDI